MEIKLYIKGSAVKNCPSNVDLNLGMIGIKFNIGILVRLFQHTEYRYTKIYDIQ